MKTIDIAKDIIYLCKKNNYECIITQVISSIALTVSINGNLQDFVFKFISPVITLIAGFWMGSKK